MNTHNVSLTISAVRKEQYPEDGFQEFAFVGRSNVGKSSMINKLLNRKSQARVSQTPGKTVTINFYNVDDTIFLVDLPGYGYAARAKHETEKWGRMMEDYLRDRKTLEQIFLLVDSRHLPTQDDLMMLDWIRHYQPDRGVIAIATKTDKLKKRELEKNLHMIWDKLGLGEDDILIPFSIRDDEGKFSVWDVINLIRTGEYEALTEDDES